MNLDALAGLPDAAESGRTGGWRPSLIQIAWLLMFAALAWVVAVLRETEGLDDRADAALAMQVHHAVVDQVRSMGVDAVVPTVEGVGRAFQDKGLALVEIRDDQGRVLARHATGSGTLPSDVFDPIALGQRRDGDLLVQGARLPSGHVLVTAVDPARAHGQHAGLTNAFAKLALGAWLAGFVVLQFLVWTHVLTLRALARRVSGVKATVPLCRWQTREVADLAAATQRLVNAERVRDQLREMTAWSSMSAGEGLLLCDEGGAIVWANLAAARLAGADGAPEALIGLPLLRLLPPEQQHRLEDAVQCMGSQAGSADESPRLHDLIGLQGDRIPVASRLSVGRFGHRMLYSLYFSDRRQELRRLADLEAARTKAERASALKSRFVAAVSHEIRTSLNGTLGMLDLVRVSRLNDEQQELVDTARQSGEILRGLLNDLLDLSKIEAGQLQLEHLEFEPVDQLRHCLRSFEALAGEKGQTLRWQTVNLPTRVQGDPLRICQVLTNLVHNAVKFTPAGGTIRIRAEAVGAQAAAAGARFELSLSVVDDGPGIDAGQLERIFQPFGQANASVAREHGGSGLGLPLARLLCRRMGGDLVHRPTPGGGSTFVARLHCETGGGGPAPAPRDDAVSMSISLAGLRVLVADDNRINRVLVERWLHAAGAETTSAGDGAQAVHCALQETFDVVLMDVSMPVSSGLDAARALRQLGRMPERGALATLPIIGVSAHAMSGDREACLESGMNDYLTKPLRRDLLLQRIVAVTQRVGESGTPVPWAASEVAES